MEGIKELRCLHFSDWTKRHPNIDQRYYARPTYTDKTANGLTACIVHYLNLSGHQAERISSEGRVIDTRQTVTDCVGRQKTIGGIRRAYSSTTIGTADISATIAGRSVKIEVKIGKDRQSEAQKAYQAAVERAGGIYIIARDFQSFYEWVSETFDPVPVEGAANG